MPAYHVERSIVINRPIEHVFDAVTDFSQWSAWSPWLVIDHDAEVTVSDDSNSVGSIYQWEGDFTGIGEIEHVELNRPTSAYQQIRFLKPFKSKADVAFTFESVDDGNGSQATKVTWLMDGSVPFFLFFMAKTIPAYIGMDYDRGLRMPKDQIETGKVESRCEVHPNTAICQRRVVGKRLKCSLSEIGDKMGPAFEAVFAAMPEKCDEDDHEVIAVYQSMDIKTGMLECVVGVTLDESIPAPGGLDECTVGASNGLMIRHTGAYHHLGNAWSGAHQFAQGKKIKLAKTPGFEVYQNSPSDTADADLVTEVWLACK